MAKNYVVVNGTQRSVIKVLGEVVNRIVVNGVTVYEKLKALVIDSVLQSGISFNLIFSKSCSVLTSASNSVKIRTYGGAQFGQGTKCFDNVDLRGSSKLTAKVQRVGGTSQAGYMWTLVHIGTLEQLNAIRYVSYGGVNDGGAIRVYYAEDNNEHTIEYDIPSLSDYSEPVYVAVTVCGYNSLEAEFVVKDLTIS